MAGNPAKAKGDRGELEAARLLAALTGYPVRRKLGAGRLDDVADLDGIPETVVQVKNYTDILRGIRECVALLEAQRVNAGATFAAGMVRRRGGGWLVVMTPEHLATWMREALS